MELLWCMERTSGPDAWHDRGRDDRAAVVLEHLEHLECSAAKLGAGFLASVSSHSIGFIFIVGRPRTYVISGLDFGSRVYLRAMGVSALARRAAPASRARMPGSLSSRRWPTAPPWRRAPATSDVPICTLSSLGSRRVREEFKRPSRPGSQATSRTGPRTCGRACTGRTRAAAHAPLRQPPRARSRSAPPEQRALRCGLSGRRPAGREEGRARRRGARAARPGLGP